MGGLRAAGLIYGLQEHHLDHIAPMAALMRIPLIVTELHLEVLATRYYPHLSTLYFDYLEVGDRIVREFDLIISSMPKDLFDQIVLVAENLRNRRVLNIYCPHGNSDKGHASHFMEGLYKEAIVLVYGQKMLDFMVDKGAYSQLYATITVGNYRFDYYKKHESFYEDLVQQEIASKFNNTNPTLLYAPTWDDAECSCSFHGTIDPLLEQMPSSWNLIVKLHPNTLQTMGDCYFLESRKNILFLEHFPPIYPLLNFIDIYLGDMSSIGYDCLTFQKPMFFLNSNRRDPKTDKGLYLYRCGRVVGPEHLRKIFSIVEKGKDCWYTQIQKEVYPYVFGDNKAFPQILKETYERFLCAY